MLNITEQIIEEWDESKTINETADQYDLSYDMVYSISYRYNLKFEKDIGKYGIRKGETLGSIWYGNGDYIKYSMIMQAQVEEELKKLKLYKLEEKE